MKDRKEQGYLDLLALLFPLYSIKGIGCEEKKYIDEIAESFLSKREFEYFMLKFGLKGSDAYSMKEIGEKMGGMSEDYLKQLERQAISKLKHKRPKEMLALFTKSRVSLIREVVKLRDINESFHHKVTGLHVSISPDDVKIPVDDEELSMKTRDALRVLEVDTINDLLEITKEDLLGVPGFGDEGLKEIKKFLGRYGLGLKKKKKNG